MSGWVGEMVDSWLISLAAPCGENVTTTNHGSYFVIPGSAVVAAPGSQCDVCAMLRSMQWTRGLMISSAVIPVPD